MVDLETREIVNENGLKLHCYKWTPKDTTKYRAIVMLIHGYGNHLTYYENLAAIFTTKLSCVVFGHDHQGMGRSEGTRMSVDKFDHYVRDCVQHVALLKKEHPGLPIIGCGQSLGGAVLLKIVLSEPDIFDAIICTAAPVNLKYVLSSPKIFLLKYVGCYFPEHMAGKADYDNVIHDTEVRNQFKEDPLVNQEGLQIKFALMLNDSLQYINDRIPDINLPCLILHGDCDHTVSLESAKELYERISSDDKSLKIYEGAMHFLPGETSEILEKIYEDLTQWTETRFTLE